MTALRRYNTLRVRVALWIAGLLFTILLIFGVFVYTSMAHELAVSVDDSLRLSAAQATAAAVEGGQISLSDGVPAPSAITTLDNRGYTIRILGVDGTVLGAFGLYQELPVSTSDVTTARAGQERFDTVIEPTQQEPVRFYTAPILANKRVIGLIQVAQSLDTINDTLEQLLTVLLIIAPLLVALATVGGYVLAARALAPIDTITRTARHISAHDLHARLNLPPTEDEVGRLAITFDEMLNRLEASFRRERQFTADASHELRTPLTAMQTMIAVTRERPRSPAEYEQVLDDFSSTTGRLKQLVEALLRLARGDEVQARVLQPVDLALLLQDVSEVVVPLTEGKPIQVTCDIEDNLTLLGDSDNLIRLFINVVDNAVKYTERGAIKIQAKLLQNTIEVRIADTGIGISAADLPHLFDRFYRADTARAMSGSGLGLAIAHAIVQAHHGTIRVESQQGQGTVVVVILPRS